MFIIIPYQLRRRNKHVLAYFFIYLIAVTTAALPLLSLSQAPLRIDFNRSSGPEFDRLTLKQDSRGAAMIAGGNNANLILDNDALLNPQTGTIAFRVKPMDWQSNDNKFHVFFEAKGTTSFVLYKYFEDSRLIWLVGDLGDTQYADIVESRVNWTAGLWQHIAVTWSPDKIALYINGALAAEKKSLIAQNRDSPGKLVFGDAYWNTPSCSKTALDDLYIFPDELNATEITRLTSPKKPVHISDFGIHSYIELDKGLQKKSVWIKADRNRFLEPDGHRVDVTLYSMTGALKGETLFSGEILLSDLERGLELPITDPKARQIGIEYAVSAKGSPLTTHKEKIDIPNTTLLSQSSSLAKMADSVPEPWRSPRLDDTSVMAAQSKFVFGETGLLAAIEVAEYALLDSPLTLHVHKNNQSIKLANTKPILSQGRSDTVDFRYDLVASGIDAFSVKGYIEFDGMLWLDVEDKTGNYFSDLETAIDIDIPLPNKLAKYMHHWTESGRNGNTTLSTSVGSSVNFPFMPFVWLGNDSHGLFWFSETAEAWPNALSKDAISVERTDGETILKLRVKKPGQYMADKGAFSFGLQPTPVKPGAGEQSLLRLSPGPNANAVIIWPEATEASFQYYGYPLPKNKSAFTRRLSLLRNKGLKAIPYICPMFVSSAVPEWTALNREWDVGLYDSTSRDVMAYGAKFALVSPNAQSWRHFLVNSVLQYHQDFGLDGIYMDNIVPYGIYSPEKGYGFVREQKAFKTYPIRAQRETLKYLYKTIKSLNPEALIIGHSSGKLAMPLLSFVDIYVDGEQFRNQVDTSYFDALPLDQFRTEFVGTQFGLTPLFIPQLRNYEQDQRPTRGLMTLTSLHNVNVWPIWSNAGYIRKFYTLFDHLRPANSDFDGYYSPTNPFSSDNPQVLVSSHCGKAKRCLLVAGNISKINQSARICARDGAKYFSAHDLKASSQPRRSNDGCIDITLAAENSLFIESLLL